MGLIKAESLPSTRVVPFSMANIEKQARARLARAQHQAEQVLAAAQREGELLREQARAEGAVAGHEQGLAHGLEEGTRLGREAALAEQREQLTAVVTALTAASEQFDTQRAELQVNVLREVVTLAVKIAERVTKRSGELDPAGLLGTVGEGLKLVG